MNTALLLSILFPIALALAGLWRPLDRIMRWAYVLAPLPALFCALALTHDTAVIFQNFLLGSMIGLDRLGRAFLILTAVVWSLSGLFTQNYFPDEEQTRRYRFFYLLTLSGNLGVTVALDAVSFYTFFGIMTVAAYGLVSHWRTEASFSAGRYYLGFALFGEMLILAGLIMAAQASGSIALAYITSGINSAVTKNWIYGCLFFGFGIKVGLVPLHFWLPRSYYSAPLPATAVLSGAMTKAGVLGWFRFLPVYGVGSESWSTFMIGAGVLMAFYGVIVGLVQSRARSALAFSSLSQMGYLTIIIGLALVPSVDAKTVLLAGMAFVFHHGLTKATMFLGLSLLMSEPAASTRRKVYWGALAFASLSLIGVPLTSGAFAKYLMKGLVVPTGPWHEAGSWILILGSVGTTLLMARFLILAWRQDKEMQSDGWRWLPWTAGMLLCVAGAWLLPPVLATLLEVELGPLGWTASWQGFWPILVGAIPVLLLTRKTWTHDSRYTPRPLEGIRVKTHQKVWLDLPAFIRDKAFLFSARVQHFIASLNIDERSARMVLHSLKLQTGWRLGMTLLLALWLLLWLFLSGEGT